MFNAPSVFGDIDVLLKKHTEPIVYPKKYTGLKVLGLVADLTACGKYRVINPLEYLNKYGASCRYLQECSLQDIMEADIIIAQRQYDPEVEEYILAEARKYGKAVIYEVDDNLHAILDSSPVFGIYHNGSSAQKMVHKIIYNSIGITVSTLELAGDYCKLNNNLEVLPNSIDYALRDWETLPKDKDKDTLVVGWSGGSTHYSDLQLLETVIPEILLKYKHVKFGIYSSVQTAQQCVEKWKIDPDRIMFISPRTFEEYPTGLPYFDIGLAPVVNCRFNASKSALKVLEYGSWGIPAVASKAPPYVTTIQEGITGYTARTPREWIEAISTLIENPDKRTEIGSNIQEVVHSDFDMAKNVHLWPEAWERIVLRAKEHKSAPTYKTLWGNVGRNERCPCGSGKKYKACTCYPAWGS
jgi:glycosyltransferase involved in cell wall biosynthesis